MKPFPCRTHRIPPTTPNLSSQPPPIARARARFLIAFLLLATPHLASSTDYVINNLGWFPYDDTDELYVSAIGQIVGTWEPGFGIHKAFLWQKGSMQILDNRP